MTSSAVPRGEMERHNPLHASLASQGPGLTCRQVMPTSGLLVILMQEGRLDEENLCAADEAQDLLGIRWCKRYVDDVRNLPPWGDLKNVIPKLAERKRGRPSRIRLSPFDLNQRVSWIATCYSLLQFAQPRPGFQPHVLDLISPDIDPNGFFEGEGK